MLQLYQQQTHKDGPQQPDTSMPELLAHKINTDDLRRLAGLDTPRSKQPDSAQLLKAPEGQMPEKLRSPRSPEQDYCYYSIQRKLQTSPKGRDSRGWLWSGPRSPPSPCSLSAPASLPRTSALHSADLEQEACTGSARGEDRFVLGGRGDVEAVTDGERADVSRRYRKLELLDALFKTVVFVCVCTWMHFVYCVTVFCVCLWSFVRVLNPSRLLSFFDNKSHEHQITTNQKSIVIRHCFLIAFQKSIVIQLMCVNRRMMMDRMICPMWMDDLVHRPARAYAHAHANAHARPPAPARARTHTRTSTVELSRTHAQPQTAAQNRRGSLTARDAYSSPLATALGGKSPAKTPRTLPRLKTSAGDD